MAGSYPNLLSLLKHNSESCATYLRGKAGITCNYIAGGCNVLANKDGVIEQNVHTDYSSTGFDTVED